MNIKIIIVLVIIIFTISCSPKIVQNSSDSNDIKIYQTLNDANKLYPDFYRSPSGNQIKITNISRVDFPESGPALVMYYETNIPIENMKEIRNEVDEIWEVFRKDVEEASVKGAAIRAVHNENDGLIRNGKGYGFVFLKRDDGKWFCTQDEKK